MQEVFTETIDYVVERIYKNYALQIMANSFLANNVTSPIFATILVEYLLERMHEMGSNMERSNLYLKLFKLVFGSVSLFAAENEQMLKPHLHAIVNKSMDLAKSAKEPYNYFLLLRALFRSIGGGSHGSTGPTSNHFIAASDVDEHDSRKSVTANGSNRENSATAGVSSCCARSSEVKPCWYSFAANTHSTIVDL